MPASGSPNLSADTSRTTPYHLLLSLCRSTAFQSCQGYSGSVPYCWRIENFSKCLRIRNYKKLQNIYLVCWIEQHIKTLFTLLQAGLS